MFDDLDEALRQLLVRELPIKKNEVDIEFKQPKREWSARISRPTLNVFLHDIRENTKLRQTQPAWEIERDSTGAAVHRRRPVRVDLHYLITAWATEPEDEHRLLARTLLALFRRPHLPDDLLPEGLHAQKAPISLLVAQSDTLQNPSDLWSALDNELRPSIICIATLALNPYEEFTTGIVRTRELRIGHGEEPLDARRLLEAAGPAQYWTIGGTVRSRNGPPENLQVKLLERGLQVKVQPEGRFAIGNLQAGDYTLEVSAEGRPPSRHKISVPAPDYEIEI